VTSEIPVATSPDPSAPPPNDDLLAVIAHSLLSSVSVIVGGTELLSTRWSELGERTRNELLVTMRGQARHVAEVLDNLVRLGDPHLVEALDGLTAAAGEPGGGGRDLGAPGAGTGDGGD
jgi:hypothetical protein